MQNKDRGIWNRNLINLLLESMADGVFTLDPQGRISSWNQSMERITGYTAKDVLGKTCKILNFSSCFDKECPLNFEVCGIYKYELSDSKECLVRHKDGYNVPVVKNGRVLRDENGSVIGIVETLTDLTELKKARLEAEESGRRLGEMYQFDNIIG
nr:PAS domain S-box protein [Desulfobacterales bacterium]